jgi:hypothetical protein
MSATSFGDGNFGIAEDEVGIIINSLDFNFTQDKQELKNRQGETTGVTYYNAKVEVSISGKVPSLSAFDSTLATSLALQNAMPDYLVEGVSGGALLIEEISVARESEDYEGIELKAVYYPNIAG